MENLYKNALIELRRPTADSYKLFAPQWDYKNRVAKLAPKTEKNQENTEKTQVLESFVQFAEKKVEQTESKEHVFSGGKIQAKQETSGAVVHQYSQGDDLAVIELLCRDAGISGKYKEQVLSNNKIKLLIVTESMIRPKDTEEYQLQEEYFFETDVAVLLNRMLKAMNLNDDEIRITALSVEGISDEQAQKTLYAQMSYYKAPYILALGATAASFLLKEAKRLKSIHGDLFPIEVHGAEKKVYSAQMMPLFSPKLLHTAPNMKKTAWKDMQKLMEKLKVL